MSKVNHRGAITNVRYDKTRTKKGNVTRSAVQKAVYYAMYGHPAPFTFDRLRAGDKLRASNPDQLPRGEWYSPAGAEKHGHVVNWAEGSAVNHPYCYRLVLSLKEGDLRPEDFAAALQKDSQNLFPDFRLVVHQDTEHTHAHVLAFRDKTLSKQQFFQWKQEVGSCLVELEQLRLQEVEQARTKQAEREALLKQKQRQADLDEAEEEWLWD